MNTQTVNSQKGFTILELIVVVAVIGLITSLTTDYMMNEGNQKRFNVTQDRIKQIQYAMIGDSSRTINNQPAISGYIADTGLKPKYIRDLLSNGYCADSTQVDQAACLSAKSEWREVNNWKGPYLQATSYADIKIDEESYITIPVFRDGWGNRNAEQDNLNFGWQFDGNFENRAFKVASYGLNGESMKDDKASPDYAYEKDLMILIHHSQIKSADLILAIKNQSSQLDGMFCLKAVYADGSEKHVDLAKVNTIPGPAVFGSVTVSGLKKNTLGQSCDQAKEYAAIDEYLFVSHNQFRASSQVEVLIN